MLVKIVKRFLSFGLVQPGFGHRVMLVEKALPQFQEKRELSHVHAVPDVQIVEILF